MAILHTQPRGVPIQRDARSEVQEFLTRLATALVAGDGETIAAMFETPALVIAEEGVIAVESTRQVADFFGAASAQYHARGVVNTRADLIDFERIGDKILIATVRWPHLDADGVETAAEESDYTIRRDRDGALKIRSVLMRGMEAPLTTPHARGTTH